MNGLILHCGSEHVTREQLRDVPTPDPTATWHPVPHHQIAELVTREAQNYGYQIASEQYGMNPSGSKLFGVLRFHPEGRPDFTRALGFRNSHDKSLAVGLTAGLSILVCDNLCFGGETVLYRKHTNRMEIQSLVGQTFQVLTMQYERLELGVTRLRSQPVGEDSARLLVVRAAEMRAIPGSDILPVLDGFWNPPHAEFAEPNRWSLYNSFTEQAKSYSPACADRCYRTLAKLFELA
jgi:hypothetical protein